MEVDFSLLDRLAQQREQNEAKRFGTIGGGGPPTDNGLEPRVRASIEKTLAILSEQMRHLATKDDLHAVQLDLVTRTSKLDTDLATTLGRLDRKADATDLAELKGRVARIPTVPVLTSILVFVSLLFAAASWAFRHLPPDWANALH